MKNPHGHIAARTPGTQAQEQLLDAAADLFYREGVRCVGIDAVIARAGLNKMSLYRQFRSKDALVLAYLERRNLLFWEKFEACVARAPDAPAQQLMHIFSEELRRASIVDNDYRGCPFVNIAAEFGDPAHPVRKFVSQHKERLLSRLTEIAAAAGAREPAELACGLALLIEGFYTASQTYGLQHPVVKASIECARQLIGAATTPA